MLFFFRIKFMDRSIARLSFAGCVGLGVWFFWLFSAIANGETVMTVDGVVREALEKNPEMQAARNRIAEAEARARTIGRLVNPELDMEIAGGRDAEGRVELGIMQRFPLTSRLRLERVLSGMDIEIARAEIRNQERLLETSVRSAFYELVFVRAAQTMGHKQVDVAKIFAKLLNEGAKEGFGSMLDGQQAELVASILQTQIELLATDEVRALGRLNSLLGRPAEGVLLINEKLNFPNQVPAQRGLGTRADLQLAELLVQAGAKHISLAQASRWEDVGVGIFVEGERFTDEPEGIEPEVLAGVRFSIPLPIWQNGEGKVAEKSALHKRLEQELAGLQQSASNEVAMTYRVLTIRHRVARELTDKMVPLAQQQVETAEAAYQRGELAIENVFRARERVVETESAALEARKNYFLSYVEWQAALGSTNATDAIRK